MTTRSSGSLVPSAVSRVVRLASSRSTSSSKVAWITLQRRGSMKPRDRLTWRIRQAGSQPASTSHAPKNVEQPERLGTFSKCETSVHTVRHDAPGIPFANIGAFRRCWPTKGEGDQRDATDATDEHGHTVRMLQFLLLTARLNLFAVSPRNRVTGYGGFDFTPWAWVELNYRPHAYQGFHAGVDY